MLHKLSSGHLGGAINDVTGQSEKSKAAGGTRDTFDTARFTNFYGDNLVAGEWRTLAEYVVEPQTEYNVGFGSAPVDETVGRFYSQFKDGATTPQLVTGMVRITTTNSHDQNKDTEVSSIATQRLDTNAGDKTKQYAQPEVEDTDKVGPDSKIKVLFKLSASSAGTTIVEGNSTALYDMTRYE